MTRHDPASIRMLTRSTPGEPTHYHLPSEKRVSGDPRQTVWLEYESACGEFSVGVWASEVGEWRVHYTEEEYCHILEGRSVITSDTGEAFVVVAGSEFTVPAGFRGTWRVEEPTRKRFVIHERAPAAGGASGHGLE